MNLLIEGIESYNNLNEERKEKMELFARFISKLKEEYCQIKIYTTNYNTIIPTYFQDVETGTIEMGLTYRDFHYNLNRFQNSRQSFFSLHGNICISREPFNKIRQNDSYSLLPDYASSTGAGDIGRGVNIFTPIISGFNKLSHVNGKPFNFGFQAFANDCANSETIYTMGFSFKDVHINSILATFPSEKVKIISVDIAQQLPLPIELRLRETSQLLEIHVSTIEDYLKKYIQ